MINKIGIKILLVIGIAIAGAGLYFGYKNFQKTLTYEEIEGMITGFQKHSNN